MFVYTYTKIDGFDFRLILIKLSLKHRGNIFFLNIKLKLVIALSIYSKQLIEAFRICIYCVRFQLETFVTHTFVVALGTLLVTQFCYFVQNSKKEITIYSIRKFESNHLLLIKLFNSVDYLQSYEVQSKCQMKVNCLQRFSKCLHCNLYICKSTFNIRSKQKKVYRSNENIGK